MKKYVPWGIIVCLSIGWAIDRNARDIFARREKRSTKVSAVEKRVTEKVWEAFEMSELIAKRKRSGRFYLPFLKRPTMSLGLYSLPRAANDKQPAHREDEVYFIENGKATLRIGEHDIKVKKGSIVFVKRDIPHRFHTIEQPLDVLVFFSSAKPTK